MESVRDYYNNYFPAIVTQLPEIEDGWVRPPESPGIGAELKPEVWERDDILTDTTSEREMRDPEAGFYIQTGFGNIFKWEDRDNQS